MGSDLTFVPSHPNGCQHLTPVHTALSPFLYRRMTAWDVCHINWFGTRHPSTMLMYACEVWGIVSSFALPSPLVSPRAPISISIGSPAVPSPVLLLQLSTSQCSRPVWLMAKKIIAAQEAKKAAAAHAGGKPEPGGGGSSINKTESSGAQTHALSQSSHHHLTAVAQLQGGMRSRGVTNASMVGATEYPGGAR